MHLATFAHERLTHRCRLSLEDALKPGVIAERFLNSSREPFDRVAFCASADQRAMQIADQVAAATGAIPLELTTSSDHGLQVEYRRRDEFAPIRIASALGGLSRFAGSNLLIVDCANSTTFTGVSRDGRVLGGAIMHGLSLWPALAAKAARVLPVHARFRQRCMGRSTDEALAGGAYHGHVGALREIATRMKQEAFADAPCVVIATGSDAPLVMGSGIFDTHEPRLIILGLKQFALGQQR